MTQQIFSPYFRNTCDGIGKKVKMTKSLFLKQKFRDSILLCLTVSMYLQWHLHLIECLSSAFVKHFWCFLTIKVADHFGILVEGNTAFGWVVNSSKFGMDFFVIQSINFIGSFRLSSLYGKEVGESCIDPSGIGTQVRWICCPLSNQVSCGGLE